ncbi:hypothetical protein PPL_06795 [Heterostelium album PN500]|uniref:Fibronectin type-III domain-containing protein n=1 Tax=Heterostelium pallidum (strain ATCC 26659 / Pp 5 / PN500) TaxID=670386 RepID=D3BFR0_HETP5|nr:hypothetical protein PPL_06795 [Heterostelium album PN500]EFA79974.1 hypothetical protein PPL_06795 [Heterostelium album PN500]|eukprot:XP_020432094.1 hypothetical protein PPL_06795 [Heterostelium album PN500]
MNQSYIYLIFLICIIFLIHTVQVKYVVIPGTFVITYQVRVNGDYDTDCSFTDTCNVKGLQPSTQYTIDVCVPVGGQICDNYVATSATTYSEVTAPVVSAVMISTNGMALHWSTTGGVPTPVTNYSITANGSPVVSGLTTTSYTINTLQPATRYTIVVLAYNDDDVKSTTLLVNTQGTLDLTVRSKTTKSMVVDFNSGGGGVVGSTTYYTVSKSSIDVPGCINITTLTCSLVGLTPNTVYSIKVVSVNEDITLTNSSVVSTYAKVSDVSLNVQSKTSKSISVKYSSLNGVPNQIYYTVSSNGISYCTNTLSTNCTVTGLNPSTTYPITVNATSDGDFSAATWSLTTNPYFEGLEFTSNDSTTSRITTNFTSRGGGPGILYSVKVNNVLYPTCINITVTYCVVTKLNSSTAYVFDLSAIYEDVLLTNSSVFYTLNPVKVSEINVTNITYKTMSLSFGSIYSLAGQSKFNVTINGTDVPGCIGISTTTCDLTGLTPGTTYAVKVSVANDGTYDEMTKLVSTYAPVSPPVITVQELRYRTLSIRYYSNGGVPGQSLYTVLINGNTIPMCIETSTLECRYSPSSFGFNYSISVFVTNNGLNNTSTYNFTSHNPPTPVNIINIVPTKSVISIEWTESQEGFQNMSTYQALLSNGNGISFHVFCDNVTNILKCTFPNLVQNLTYTVRVSVLNTIFDPVNTTIKVNTLSDQNDNCKTGNTDCNGNGVCSNGNCNCKTGWIGQYCEIKTNPGDQNPPIIVPDPESPGVIIDDKGITYSFSIGQIQEIDSASSPIKTLNVSSFEWDLTMNTDINITNEINGQITEKSWQYSIKSTNRYFKSMNVTFYQFLAIPTITQNDYYEYQYAGQTYSIKLGSFKYTLNISEWDFQSRLNTLEISSIISAPIGGSCDPEFNISIVDSGDINLINIGDNNGNSVFGRLVNRVVLDSIPRSISHRAIENTNNQSVSIVSVIPFFESTLFIDPDFSTLISVDGKVSCSSNSDNKWKIIVGAVVGGVVAVALVTATVYFVHKKKKNATENARVQMKLKTLNKN